MIKVLNIITDSNIGGAGRCLINYLRYCDRSNFEVKVILPRGSLLIPEVQALDYSYIEADHIAERSFSPEALGALLAIIRRERPDIVHTHGSFSGRIAAKLAGCKVIYTRHGAFPVSPKLKSGPGHWLNGLINGFFAHQIVAVSPATAENLVESGVREKKITVIANGVAQLPTVSPEKTRMLKAQWNLPEGTFVAGFPARLEVYKGHQLLLDAAARLKAQGRDFRILIAGSGTEEAAIQAKIQELDLSSHVLFLGFVEDMAGLFSVMDVQLNCSYESEACSLSIIEGMGAGVPAVASRCSGNPWLVADGVTGLLFENNDSADLARKLAFLMDHPEQLESMRLASLQAYQRRFTGEIFAANLESLYQNTLNRK